MVANSVMIPASAFILIGGESKRFGSPKWQTIINGQTILDRIWNACEYFIDKKVVGKTKPEGFELPFISDQLDIQAPIIGLLTSLTHSETDWTFILSCDLPLMVSAIPEKLWELEKSGNKAIVPIVQGQKQPTCAFYHKEVFDMLKQKIDLGKLGLHGLVNSINTIYVEMDDFESEFTNMNTQKDYQKIIKM